MSLLALFRRHATGVVVTPPPPPPPPPVIDPSPPSVVLGEVVENFTTLVTVDPEMPMSYDLGQTVTIGSTFRLNGHPYDPPTVTLTVTKPGTADVVVTSGFIHNNVGEYEYDFTTDVKGSWVVTWRGSGDVVDAKGNTRTYQAVKVRRMRVA